MSIPPANKPDDFETRLAAIPEKARARMQEIANKAAAEQPDFKDASDARNASLAASVDAYERVARSVPVALPLATPDPLAGIPDPDRACIQENAEWVRRTVFHDTNNRRLDGPEGIAEKTYRDAIAAGVAAQAGQSNCPNAPFCGCPSCVEAAQPAPSEPVKYPRVHCPICPFFATGGARLPGAACPNEDGGVLVVSESETLTREEATERLRQEGLLPNTCDRALHDCRFYAEHPDSTEAERAILRAYARHLDKQAQASTDAVEIALRAPTEPEIRRFVEAQEHTEPRDLGLVHYSTRTHRGSRRIDLMADRIEKQRPASAPYHPTDEQHQHPLCHALAMQGVTEREAIEALYRFDKARHELIATLTTWKPGTIEGRTYTNPTADKLAEEGRAKALADLMKAHLAALRRAVESGQPIDIILDLANLEDLIEPFAASLAIAK